MENAIFFEDFVEHNSTYDSDIFEQKYKKGRGKARNWLKVKEFEEASEAELHVENEGLWKRTSRKQGLDGEKIEFRCRYGEYRKSECPAAIYLLYHASSMKVSLYSTESEHIHKISIPTRSLPSSSKKFVADLFKSGVQKPNAILAAFRKENLIEPSKSQLVNFLRTLREKTYGQCTISGNELNDWCTKKQIVPEDMDALFVLYYKIECDPINIENQDIKIVLSTKRLLENLGKSSMIQIDTTHKVIWQGYPVIIAGTSDKDNVFHPFAISVCQRDDENDFSFIFSALQKYNVIWKPTILLADGSTAITNGFSKTFGKPSIRLICYFQVIQAIEKRLKSINYAADIKNDVNVLQICNSSETFNQASQLFLEKWYEKCDLHITEFLDYFKEEWLKKNQNWYEGAALGYPSTNNGIEATNAIIKKCHTIRERLPLGQFLNNLNNLLSKWSKDRDPLSPNYKEFCLKETISLKDWIDAYQWAQLNKKVLQFGTKFYTCSSNSEIEDITTQLVSQYIEKQWKTFEEFKEIYFSVWVIETENDKFVCSCPTFMKNYKCKHALGLQIQLKKVDVPQEVKIVSLVEKRKRGRPATPKRALIV